MIKIPKNISLTYKIAKIIIIYPGRHMQKKYVEYDILPEFFCRFVCYFFVVLSKNHLYIQGVVSIENEMII